MYDPADSEKIADVSLHQRFELMRLIQRLHEALTDIEELVEDEVDLDRNGGPNLAMKIYAVVSTVLETNKGRLHG